MSKNGKFNKRSELQRQDRSRPSKSVLLKGRDILRLEESFRIAPKHPGMGRR